MQTRYIIIGQGIAGTLLSYELYKAGQDFVIFDNENQYNASYTAAAIINPLAGKHWKPAPDATPVIGKALSTYNELGALLGCTLIRPRELYYFPGNEADKLHYEKQQRLSPDYLDLITDTEMLHPYFNMPHAPGRIKGLWQVDARHLLERWRDFLKKYCRFVAAEFCHEQLKINRGGIEYGDICADKIIFCDGAAGIKNPWLKHIPFTSNRGDVLLLDIPDLPTDALYEQGLRLVPYADSLFWCGSNYQWKYNDLMPDNSWRTQALQLLNNWLRIPFTIIDHKVAERPTTAGQKVFAGINPEVPSVAYLNGLGTRGFSAGPFWAAQLAKML